MGIMIITCYLCCSFLLREGLLLLLHHGVPSTGGSRPWASRMRAFAMGYSPSQHGFVTRSQISPANLFQCELLSSGVHRVHRSDRPAPVWAVHSVLPPSRMSTSLPWPPLRAEVDLCSAMTSMGCRDTAGSLWSHRGSSAPAAGVPRVPPALTVNMCPSFPLSFILAALVQQVFFFLPEELPLPPMGSALGKSFSQLAALPLANMKKTPSIFSQKPSQDLLATKPLLCKCNTPSYVNPLIQSI